MYNQSDLKRSIAKVSVGTIEKNYLCYRDKLPGGTKVVPVIKADGYGHGAVVIAKRLSSLGADFFAVSNIEEAEELRSAGIEGEILILGFTPAECAERLYKGDITQALVDEDYARALADTGIKVKCHFALDTGMRRIGLNADFPEACERVIREYAGKLNLTGLFTHLCVADTDTEECVAFTKGQIAKFRAVADRVSDLKLPFVHCANSAAGLFHGEGHIARLGIILYGLKPDYLNTLPEEIKPALTWESYIAMVKTIGPGDTVGYGRTFKADREIRVATVPTGYADGYRRELSNRFYVLVNGKRANIIGRVCMDQFMIDVTGIDVKPGDTVTLIGTNGSETITADDMAEAIGTIGYEIVCGISKRVPRIYG
ncbi:MAG: alanine racemase [Oscillospiraceae bacterium]|nr:alanine racemase [Oscillospiraceae bacterium]